MATKFISGVFQSRQAAEDALNSLEDLGYSRNEVNMLISKNSPLYSKEGVEDSSNAGSMAVEGAGVGGAIGSAVAATIAGLAAIGTSLAIPGLGLIIAGPVVAALVGGGAGAATGSLIGGLIGLGIPEQNAKVYESALREGGIVLGVQPHANADAKKIDKIFSANGAKELCSC